MPPTVFWGKAKGRKRETGGPWIEDEEAGMPQLTEEWTLESDGWGPGPGSGRGGATPQIHRPNGFI